MKDKQGIIRGKCMIPGCECNEYMAPQDTKSVRCGYCDHAPVKHLKMIKLGACSCGECDSYESEDTTSYPICGYCDCPAQRHKGAEQSVMPSVAQPTPTQMAPAGIGQPTGSHPASMPPSGAMAPGVVPKCKIPNCVKPCFVERSGRVHEFCGRGHAELYTKSMTQQAPMQALKPVMHKQPASNTVAVLYKPPPSPSATRKSPMLVTSQPQQPPPGSAQLIPMATPPAPSKVCEKCQRYPANPNYEWCQHCFAQKS